MKKEKNQEMYISMLSVLIMVTFLESRYTNPSRNARPYSLQSPAIQTLGTFFFGLSVNKKTPKRPGETTYSIIS